MQGTHKRYSKCGFACSLKHLKSFYIHLCWQTVEQQFIPALAIASAVMQYFNNMAKISISIFILSIIALQSCSSTKKVEDKEFSNSSILIVEDKEFSNLQKTFRETYRKESYPIYEEKIITSTEDDYLNIIYSGDTICLNKDFSKYASLFSSGLISSLIIGNPYSHLTRIDEVKELTTSDLTHQTRVFRLYGVNKNVMNPFKCYIEIENRQAKKNWELEMFIPGAKITFLKTMIIL